jgi:alpha-tubulin suppressor-like RCC1 family protein
MKKLYFLLLTFISLSAFAQNYNYTTYNVTNSGIGSNYIGDIKVDDNGLLWLSTYNGVTTFDGTTFTNYNTSNSGIASNAIIKTEIDGLGRKWIASQINGIILRIGTTWTNYTSANSGLPSNFINDIAVDGLNNLWIATTAGLTKFNGTTWTTYTSLTSLNSIAIDSSNGVWVANDAGVLYKFNGTDYNLIFQGGVNKILKIANNTVYCHSGDALMTFTTAGTLIAIQYQNNSCLADYQLNALDVDSNNKVWIAFNGNGIQNFTNCVSYTTANSGLPDNSFSTLRTQTSGIIWAGTLQLGLVKMTPSTNTCIPPTNFLSTNVTSTTATLNWTAPTPATTSYIYLYNTSPTLGGIDGGTTTTSANLTGLIPNADYYWWVASVCGNTQSDWVLGGFFGTPSLPTGCWQKINGGLSRAVAIKSDGTLWTWGDNFASQIGCSCVGNKLVPYQLGTSIDWKTVEQGSIHTLALKNNGTLWAWGQASYGKLGNGSTSATLTAPTQIGTANDWKVVAAGFEHSAAIKNNGTLWTWGRNNFGQLGIGNLVDKNIPTQVGTGTDWKNVVMSTSSNYTLAIKNDGTIWAWGNNGGGQLGDGTTINRLVPTQIGTLNTWQSITVGSSQSHAIKTDGTLWGWGYNFSGQVGDGTNVNKLIPTQIGTGTNWQTVDGGAEHTFAKKTNGSIWTWGLNSDGQLGTGNYTNSNIPIQVGTGFGWQTISSGHKFNMSLKVDGSLWVWGANNNSALGLGIIDSNKTSPVAVACPGNLSIDDFAVYSNLNAYPNPVKDMLNLSFEKEISTVSIFNLIGQEVVSKSINAKEDTIDTSMLPAGSYFAKILIDDKIKTLKFIKK